MKKTIFAATVFACGLALLAGCTKELQTPAENEPSGNETTATSRRIQLTTEGYESDTKSSVLDNSVQWVDGDVIMLSSVRWEGRNMIANSQERQVTVSGGNAYITAGDLITGASEVFAFYPTGVIVDESGWMIYFPSKYDSSIDGNGRQVIALPMMAYADNSGNDVTSLEFKHQTAAVKVMLWNATETDLTVTRVVVKTDNYLLNGAFSLTDEFRYREPMLDYTPKSDNDSMTGRVDVNFPGYGESGALVIPAGDDTKSVQVPFYPIGKDQMTIEIHLTDGTNPYIYRHKASNPALARNQMMTAKAKLDLGGNMKSAVVNLTDITRDYEAQDGEILTGTLGSDYKLTIAAGATVTLAGMTHHAGEDINGIECLGNATIILANGTVNDLTRGHDEAFFGIAMGSNGDNFTLTIEGSGTLNVSGGDSYAGIGGHNPSGYQDLVINGGIITATGGFFAAGIGSGNSSAFGNITINGGEIVAIGGVRAAAIGCGNNGQCGTITINDGITSLKAIKGNSGYYIGGGSGNYGTITVDGITGTNNNIHTKIFPHFNSEISTTTNTNDTWTLTH